MATILVEILGNASQFKQELQSVHASTEKANGGFAKLQRAAGVAGLALAGGLAVGLIKSVEAADEMQQSTARMNAAFDASHVSVKAFQGGIEDAESAARKLGFQNEQVRGSLGSLVIATHDGHKALADLGIAEDIARFKHISLEAATKTLTMAMAGSQRATKQLGIDVPKVTEHYDALRATMGPTIDAHEKMELAQAKLQDKMATSNKVIATVSEKLHGQAQAYADTAAGGMAQFHAQLTNLAEKLGTALLPAITSVSLGLASLAGFFSEHETLAQALVIALGAVAAVLITVSVATSLVSAAMAIATAATAAWEAATWLLTAALAANPIGLVIIAIAALVAGVIIAYRESGTFRTIVTAAFDAVKTAAQAVLDFFTNSWDAVKGLIKAPFEAITEAAQTAFGVGTAISSAFQKAKDWVIDNWPIIATIISGPFAPIVLLATDGFGVRTALIGAMDKLKTGVSDAIGDVVTFFKDLPGRITSALGDVSTLLYNAGASIIQGLIDGMTSKIKAVEGLASGLAGKIASLKGPLEADRVLLVPHGKAIIEGLQAGLSSGLGNLNRMTASIAPTISQNVAAAPLAAATGGGGGGGASIYVTVNGWVGNDQDLAERLRNELIRTGRNTTGGVLGGF